MITEDYVSFEVAKLLKEKGFDEFTFSDYNENGIAQFNEVETRVAKGYQRPTLQMAMKWLREEHDLHIMVNCVGKVNYDPIVQRFDGKDFEVEGTEVSTMRLIDDKYVKVRRGFKTCESACEAAIRYCLENLI